MTEEERAALHRQQEEARAKAETARLAALSGNSVAAENLRARYAPLLRQE